jgi:serine/threonine protein kinase
MTPIEQVQAIVNGPSPDLPPGPFGPQMRDFVHLCLQRDPEKRPAVEALLRHPFLKKSKGRDFLAGTVMAALPPLSQRFELLHRNANVARPQAPAARPPITFDFAGDEQAEETLSAAHPPEPSTVAQIGRFKVVVQRRQRHE